MNDEDQKKLKDSNDYVLREELERMKAEIDEQKTIIELQ
jgi:hypothetical protein